MGEKKLAEDLVVGKPENTLLGLDDNLKHDLTEPCPLILIEKLNYPFFSRDMASCHVVTVCTT
jgi:hypothetical protein